MCLINEYYRNIIRMSNSSPYFHPFVKCMRVIDQYEGVKGYFDDPWWNQTGANLSSSQINHLRYVHCDVLRYEFVNGYGLIDMKLGVIFPCLQMLGLIGGLLVLLDAEFRKGINMMCQRCILIADALGMLPLLVAGIQHHLYHFHYITPFYNDCSNLRIRRLY